MCIYIKWQWKQIKELCFYFSKFHIGVYNSDMLDKS